MKLIKTTEAVGQVLCHDITQIIPGVTKDAVFRKGHIITEEDIPVLLSVGKEHIYIWEKNENILHENEAAEILRDICMDEHMKASQPKEGKIELTAETDGLFLADKARLKTINSLGRIMIAIRSAGVPVKKGDKLCGTRIIPLVIEKEAMEKAKALAGDTPIRALGISTLHFGILFVVGIAIGMITPPVAINLFVASGITNLPLEKISKAVVPYLIGLIVVFLAIVYLPLFIPGFIV